MRLTISNGMKKQIVFIHGGTAFSSYDAFLQYLKTCEIKDPLEERPKRWKDTLRDDLGEEYEVFMPTMPNKQNARYDEWKIWFERHFGFLRDGVILIGHSQGGIFLLKYLSENKMPIKVGTLYLIASPGRPPQLDGELEDGGDFVFDESRVKSIENQVEKTFIFQSTDDPVVLFTHAEKLKELLPEAELVTFEDKGHFLEEKFPELLEHIRAHT